MSHVQAAFEAICTEFRQAGHWYVSLVEHVPFYGGPEEGGWWGTDSILIAYQEFPSEKLAEEAAARVKTLAHELDLQARRAHGEHCLRELEFLEARGLDANFLPEPDGPSTYAVTVSQEIPSDSRGCRQYS